MRLELTIPATPPSGNNYVRHGVIAGMLRSYQTKEAKAYKALVASIAAGRSISPEELKLRAKVAYRIVITVVLGKGQRLDADNSLKVGIDALKECGVIHSDARVREAIGRVVWDDRDNPRTEIIAEVLETHHDPEAMHRLIKGR